MKPEELPRIRKLFRDAALLVAQSGGSTKHVVIPGSYAQVETLVVPRYYPRLAGFRPEELARVPTRNSTKPLPRPAPLSVRMSERQKQLLRDKAKAVGISVNRYVVATALGTDYRPPADPALVRAFLKLARELSSQGNNLNQIARHLNADQLSPSQGLNALTSLVEALQRTYGLIRHALAEGKGDNA